MKVCVCGGGGGVVMLGVCACMEADLLEWVRVVGEVCS